MPVREYAEVRPRNVGEILDDGWRLYLADMPLLLALSGLFLIPAAAVLLVLLTQDPVGGAALWWPALGALLLPLTGLGAGACQEAFHLWAEDAQPTLGRCLRAAARRGVNHALVQLLAIFLPMAAAVWFLTPSLPPWARWLGALVLGMLGLPVCLLGLARHAVLAAGQKNPWKAWRRGSRASGRHPLKAMIILSNRLVLLVFAMLNLHVFGQFASWAAESLGGFDVALARLLCSLGNPPYLFALAALAWWLLAPYLEAVNYLFFVDDRTRYEGLDLWYRVEEFFPRQTASRAGVALLVLSGALLSVPTAHARAWPSNVHEARAAVGEITNEVKEANPYPGSAHYVEPLRAVGRVLDPEGNSQRGRFRWYFQSIEGFGKRDRADAVKTLEGITRRLALIEDSLDRSVGAGRSKEQIKALVPPGREAAEAIKKAEKQKLPPKEEKNVDKDDGAQVPPAGPRGPGVFAPAGLGGLAHVVLILLLGLVVAVVAVGTVLAVRHWLQNRQPPKPRREGSTAPAAENLVNDLERQDVASLWQQSDQLARAGHFLEAVRTLYLAVLALLHQAALIRFERTRTNGEYADQLRPRSTLHGPFIRLTDLFEVKWYGERACRESDYATCRGYAEDIRVESKGNGAA